MRLVTIMSTVLLLAVAGRAYGTTDEEYLKAGKDFAQLLVDAQYAKAVESFDETMTEAVPIIALETLWSRMALAHGPFQGLGEPTISTHAQYKIVFVPCKWERAAFRMRVVFDPNVRIAGLFFDPAAEKPEYLQTNPTAEREITVGSGKWELPGTLALPNKGDVVAGVVFVHGSGPNDRDETIGPNKPFRDLTWGLGRHGIATLRYDKRTRVHGPLGSNTLDPSLTLKEEVIDDALLALDVLRAQKELKGKPVYLLGHSLGATLAPEIAAADGGLAGVIMLAAMARPFDEIVLEQLAYVVQFQSDPLAKARIAQMKKKIEAVRKHELKPADSVLGGDTAAYWYDFLERDGEVPIRLAASLPCRILVIQGGRDYQVTTEDFKLWQSGLAKHPDATCRLFDNLNHLMAPGAGKATPAEYGHENFVDPPVIDLISEWCRSR